MLPSLPPHPALYIPAKKKKNNFMLYGNWTFPNEATGNNKSERKAAALLDIVAYFKKVVIFLLLFILVVVVGLSHFHACSLLAVN